MTRSRWAGGLTTGSATPGHRRRPSRAATLLFRSGRVIPNGLTRPTAGGGKTHRLIVFTDTPRDQFTPVSLEESLNRQLEHRAYVRARGEESTAVQGGGRRRR